MNIQNNNPVQSANRQIFYNQLKDKKDIVKTIINEIVKKLDQFDTDIDSRTNISYNYDKHQLEFNSGRKTFTIYRLHAGGNAEVSEAKRDYTVAVIEQIVKNYFQDSEADGVAVASYLKSKCYSKFKAYDHNPYTKSKGEAALIDDDPVKKLKALYSKLDNNQFLGAEDKAVKTEIKRLRREITPLQKVLSQNIPSPIGGPDAQRKKEYISDIDVLNNYKMTHPNQESDVNNAIWGIKCLFTLSDRNRTKDEIDPNAFLGLFNFSLVNEIPQLGKYSKVFELIKKQQDDLVEKRRALDKLTGQNSEKPLMNPNNSELKEHVLKRFPEVKAENLSKPAVQQPSVNVKESAQAPQNESVKKPEVSMKEPPRQQPLREPAQPAQPARVEEKQEEPVKVPEPPAQQEPPKISLPKEPKVVVPANDETVTNEGQVQTEVVEDASPVEPEAPVKEAKVEEKQPEPPRTLEQGAVKPASRNPFVRFFSWVSSLFTRFVVWLRR